MRLSPRLLASAALAAVLLTGAPAAASASTIYPPTDACRSSSATPGPGETFSVQCSTGTFGADEPVTVTVTGENAAAARFGVVRTAITTASTIVRSDADGALPALTITLPSDARGVYNIALVSPTSAGGTTSVAIGSVAEDGTLSVTGFDSSRLLGVWIGGGALVLAGTVVLGAVALRRYRAATDD